MQEVALITVAYINNDAHYNLAKKTYESINQNITKICVVNHLKNKRYENMLIKNNNVVVYNKENNLAKAWNLGIETAINLKKKYFIICNLDIMFHEKAIGNLLKFAHENPQALFWSGTALNSLVQFNNLDPEFTVGYATNHDQSFSCFLISDQTIKKVGKFYEGFGVYYEDDDYLRRLKLAKLQPLKTGSSLFYHFVQGTVKNDPTLIPDYLKKLEVNKQKYIKRWGGVPGQETLEQPNNE